jgi:hypothetical protein
VHNKSRFQAALQDQRHPDDAGGFLRLGQRREDDLGRLSQRRQDLHPHLRHHGPAGEAAGQHRTKANYHTETRSYNSLLQLTRLTVPGVIDHEYRHPARQNNGRVSQHMRASGWPNSRAKRSDNVCRIRSLCATSKAAVPRRRS